MTMMNLALRKAEALSSRIVRVSVNLCVCQLVPGAAATKPPPPVIFCQVGVSHICSGGGDFGKLQ